MKRLIVFVFFFFFVFVGRSQIQSSPQAPQEDWESQKFTLGGKEDVITSVRVDGNGNTYSTGWLSIFQGDVARASLVKLSSDGSVAWTVLAERDSTYSYNSQIAFLSDNSAIWMYQSLYVTDSTRMECRAPDSTLLWRRALPKMQLYTVTTFGDTIAAVMADRSDGMVYFFDRSGSLIRTIHLGNEVLINCTPRIRNGKLVLVANYTAGSSGVSVFAACYDIYTGQTLWRQNLIDMFRGFGDIDTDGNVYVGGSLIIPTPGIGDLLKFTRVKFGPDGQLLWRQEWYSQPLHLNGNHENWVDAVSVTSGPASERVVALIGEAQQDTVDTGARIVYVAGFSARTGDSLWLMTWHYPNSRVTSGRDGEFDRNNDLFVLGQNYQNGATGSTLGYGIVYKFTVAPDAVRELPDLIPKSFSLEQNYPNPFNPTTTIRYGLPNRSHVTLIVYNTLGQQVAQLMNGEEEAGYHSVRFDGSNLASGVYFYRLQAGTYVETRKLLLLK